MGESCGVDGWDGASAAGIRPAAVSSAVKFVEALPSRLPSPSVGTSGEGEVTLEWGWSKKASIKIRFDGGERIPYVASIGKKRVEGELGSAENFADIVRSAMRSRGIGGG